MRRVLCLWCLFLGNGYGQPPSVNVGEEPVSEEATEDDSDEVIEIVRSAPPGSQQDLTEEELRAFANDDPHAILGGIPGVYVRQEDGYGLRPNIGMRGTGSERSKKIALMEDGVLFAPAPYSAPAAYFFPLMNRMVGVEATKGPSSIQYGPNTVGGALNFLSRRVPWNSDGSLAKDAQFSLAGGSHRFTKVATRVGVSQAGRGILLEGTQLSSGGFKKLDGGGGTGFRKYEILAKGRQEKSSELLHQVFSFKVGVGQEVSNETYTGLSKEDFEQTPYRRYLGTQLDQMRWTHLRGQLDWEGTLESGTQLRAVGYWHRFHRKWRKLDGFRTGPDLVSVLENPDSLSNQLYYQLLTGQTDTTSPSEQLLLGTNDRLFYSKGVEVTAEEQIGANQMMAGVRVHHDSVRRIRDVESVDVLEGELVPGAATEDFSRLASTFAISAFLNDEIEWNDFVFSAGLRGEAIRSHAREVLGPDRNWTVVLLPGGGVRYRVHQSVEVLAGVHRGFVPVAPGSAPEIQPETSIGYEAGARFSWKSIRGEVIAFASDYQNLLGTCTFSTGCDPQFIGQDFSGGSVLSLGVESVLEGTQKVSPKWDLLWRANYSAQRSTFQEAFSSSNPLWGNVEKGDKLPYLPVHQYSLSGGLVHAKGELHLRARGQSSMNNRANPQGDDDVLPAQFTLDASIGVVGLGGKWMLFGNNLLNQQKAVSIRPYGFRPSAPRDIRVEYTMDF